MIAIIDYQMGNLRSVEKAFLKAGARAVVTSDRNKILKAKKVVLPGVGAFGDVMKELKKLRLISVIKDSINDSKPFFGVCLGMQLLFEKSEEAKGIPGLGILKGSVKKFRLKPPLKVPHMGWNQLKGISGKPYVYFVHSYYCDPKDKDIITATTDYGINFASMIQKGNIYGCQFHPEKSQGSGLKILESFIKKC
ncbi:MAG: imidazole glycerol phosphate synthase subunit HisH [Candidatus Omnitrophica bacterium CG10_big_fil_rev_8_21_14_0_10_43_8]|nr:MAG: imidazole glycerol phosphate synthase subunit HisH [Candidatus Omnitrophica bacterium CG10_big_fil_rev_8_21_14_0_10_43_8]